MANLSSLDNSVLGTELSFFFLSFSVFDTAEDEDEELLLIFWISSISQARFCLGSYPDETESITLLISSKHLNIISITSLVTARVLSLIPCNKFSIL
jgi:hypothetical protein